MSFYLNGNYQVIIPRANNGTQVYIPLRVGEDLVSDFPDSIDLKITNRCSNGCKFCHESSTPDGKHFNLVRTCTMLSKLPKKPIEIAIGGGNIFEVWDDFFKLVNFIQSHNMRPRFTVNIVDLLKKENREKIILLYNLASRASRYGIGISIPNLKPLTALIDLQLVEEVNEPSLKSFCTNFWSRSFIKVFHIILGIFPVNEFEKLLKLAKEEIFSVLILGYKQFGRAENESLPDMSIWKSEIKKTLDKFDENVKIPIVTVGFDNLAVEQLGLKDMVESKTWESVYLGQDFSHSMYVDAVEETFAPTSRSNKADRVAWDSTTSIVDWFKENKKPWNS